MQSDARCQIESAELDWEMFAIAVDNTSCCGAVSSCVTPAWTRLVKWKRKEKRGQVDIDVIMPLVIFTLAFSAQK